MDWNRFWSMVARAFLVATLFASKAVWANSLVVYTSGSADAAKEMLARLPLQGDEVGAAPKEATAAIPFPGKDGVAITGAAEVRRCVGFAKSPAELEKQLQVAYSILDEELQYADAARAFSDAWEACTCATGPLPPTWLQRLRLGWGISLALKAEEEPTELGGERAAAMEQFQAALTLGVTAWPKEYAPQGGGYTAFLEAKVAMADDLYSSPVNNWAQVQNLVVSGYTTPEVAVGFPALLQWQDKGEWRALGVESAGARPTLWSYDQWVAVLQAGPKSPEEEALIASTFDANQALKTVLVVDAGAGMAWRWHTRASAAPVEWLTATPIASTPDDALPLADPPPKAKEPRARAQGIIVVGGHATFWGGHLYGGPTAAFGGRPHPRVELLGVIQGSFTRWDGYTFALPGGGVELGAVIPLRGGNSALVLGGGGLLEVAEAPPQGAVAGAFTGHGTVALHLQRATTLAAARVSVQVGGGTGGFRASVALSLAILPP